MSKKRKRQQSNNIIDSSQTIKNRNSPSPPFHHFLLNKFDSFNIKHTSINSIKHCGQ